ncbi:unnamed protein product [Leptosia nina]|uniref:Uncharacterized protein n=1 Tax=Leptosia nina TaxID=320188 RepID=A0AAV1JCN0_9NEOP
MRQRHDDKLDALKCLCCIPVAGVRVDGARAYISAQYRGGRPLCPTLHTPPPSTPTHLPPNEQFNTYRDLQLRDKNRDMCGQKLQTLKPLKASVYRNSEMFGCTIRVAHARNSRFTRVPRRLMTR